MTNKALVGLCVAVAVVGGLLGGFLVNVLGQSNGSLGTSTPTASNALNQQRLINEFTAVAAPLQNWGSFSGSFSLGTLNNNTGVTSTVLSTAGVAVGDKVVMSVPLVTSTALGYYAFVSGAGSTTVVFYENGSTTVSMGATGYNLTTFPSSSFIAVTGL